MPRMPFILLMLLAMGCGGHGPSVPPSPPTVQPPQRVTFSQNIHPQLLALSCGGGTSGCHGQSPLPAGYVRYDVNFTRTTRQCYDELMAFQLSLEGWSVVKPGDPSHSLIYEKVISRFENRDPVTGHAMPPNAQIDESSARLLRTWIEQGAPYE